MNEYMYESPNQNYGQQNAQQQDPYVSRIEFNRYKKFQNMQATSLFIQIEQLKDYVKKAIPVKTVPKRRKEAIDKIVPKLQKKIMFLEKQINQYRKTIPGDKQENDNGPSNKPF